VERIRKDKEKFRSARKIPPSGKPALASIERALIPQGPGTNSTKAMAAMLVFQTKESD
jgi:hypothetical protein